MQKTDENGFGHIDIRALRFLALVLELRSVTSAGESMGLSQPAASRLLAQLRRAMGDDPLLVRARGGGYVPTVRAAELMPKLTHTLAATDLLFARNEFDPATSKRVLRVATTDYGSAVVLTGLACDLAKSAPGISLDVRPMTTDTLNDLEEGRVDFALYTDDELPPSFRHQKLFNETFACVVRHDHPVLKHRDRRGRVSIAQLAELPRVLLVYIDGSKVEVDDPLEAFGGKRKAGSFFTPYFLSAPLLLGGSDHVMCIARRAADLVASMAKVTVVDIPEAGGFTYCTIWHERADGDGCLAWIRQRVERCIA
jgi:DNA-binding transcriptional LysR family regulator